MAHHEAGHALMSVLLHVPVARATIVGTTSGSGGAVFREDEQKSLISRKDMLNRIMIAYGGRAAEELIFGAENVTTGAINDIQQATAILKSYISDYGFDEDTGLLSLEILYEQKLLSERVVKRAEQLSGMLYSQTVTMLYKNKDKLLRLAKALSEKETMTGDEIVSLVGE
ncbi:MAG: hypothetical protein V3G42_14300 [Oscillospiraceae bacterium]